MSHDYKTSPTPKYRFFLFDPEPEWEGLMFFRSEAERDAAAKEAIDAYKDVDNGWSAEVERLLMGEATHVCTQTNVVKRPPAVARKALKEAQEQEPVAYMIHEYQGTGEKRLQFQPHIPSIRDDVTGPIVTALYARPVPAAPAVAVPEMTDDALKEMLNAAQIVGYDDPLRIVRGFAMRVLQEWGNQQHHTSAPSEPGYRK